MHVVVRIAVVVVFVVFFGFTGIHAYTIDFEDLFDGDPVGNHYAGLGIEFTNATILAASITLDDLEYPPYSGSNVVFDDGGPLSIDLAVPLGEFSAHFTYALPLTVTFYDGSGTQIGSFGSAFQSNRSVSGDPGSLSNECLSFAWAGGISRVVILGDTAGASFVMDDMTGTPVPEPSVLMLLGLSLFWLSLWFPGKRTLSPVTVHVINELRCARHSTLAEKGRTL